jgi:hypothetical protein
LPAYPGDVLSHPYQFDEAQTDVAVHPVGGMELFSNPSYRMVCPKTVEMKRMILNNIAVNFFIIII